MFYQGDSDDVVCSDDILDDDVYFDCDGDYEGMRIAEPESYAIDMPVDRYDDDWEFDISNLMDV